jgi:hypothetical protein
MEQGEPVAALASLRRFDPPLRNFRRASDLDLDRIAVTARARWGGAVR